MFGYIYLTTNKITGKQYIGQHVKSKFDKKYKGSGRLLLKAFDKYGFDNFECHIIDTAETQDELNDKEYVYVELYQTRETGYNLAEGGGSMSGYKHSEESKKNMSIAQKGKIKSVEHKNKLSESHKGKKHSDASKIRMKENHCDCNGGKNPRSIKCIYNGMEFDCIKDAWKYAVKNKLYNLKYISFYNMFSNKR